MQLLLKNYQLSTTTVNHYPSDPITTVYEPIFSGYDSKYYLIRWKLAVSISVWSVSQSTSCDRVVQIHVSKLIVVSRCQLTSLRPNSCDKLCVKKLTNCGITLLIFIYLKKIQNENRTIMNLHQFPFAAQNGLIQTNLDCTIIVIIANFSMYN